MLKFYFIPLLLTSILLFGGSSAVFVAKSKINKKIGLISESGNNNKDAEITNQISSKDSVYTDALTQFGDRQYQITNPQTTSQYSNYQNVGQPNAYQYSIYPYNTNYDFGSQYSNVGGDSQVFPLDTPEESSGSWLCSIFSGLCSNNTRQDGQDTLGILGLVAVGLKKLKLFKFAPVLPLLIPFLPILLPILLILAIPVILIAWFLPVIPIVVIGRNMSVSALRSVHEVLESEKCLERISCEASRVAKGLGFEAPWMNQFLKKASLHSKWIEKIDSSSRSISCASYNCRPVTSLQKSLNIKSE